MFSMPIVNLAEISQQLAESGKRVRVLWQHDDTLAFVARGREYRSEFHINPSDETMHMIKGEMRLHYRTPGRKRRSRRDRRRRDDLHPRRHAALAALPARRLRVDLRKKTPPRRDRPISLVLPKMRQLAARRKFVVHDYAQDPVSKAYQRFFESVEFRTCKQCGEVMPAPDAL